MIRKQAIDRLKELTEYMNDQFAILAKEREDAKNEMIDILKALGCSVDEIGPW